MGVIGWMVVGGVMVIVGATGVIGVIHISARWQARNERILREREERRG